MVPLVSDDWTRLAHAVRDRRQLLGLTQNEAVSRAEGNLSLATWRNIETATRPPYRRAGLLAVCRALGWTPDSIDRILTGGSPRLVEQVLTPSQEERLAALEAELAHLREQLGLPPRQRNGGESRSA